MPIILLIIIFFGAWWLYSKTHKRGFPVKCPYCGSRVYIDSPGAWKCPHCNKAFAFKESKVWTREEYDSCHNIITCPYCNADGIEIGGEGNWICPECKKTFKFLNSHVYKEEEFIQVECPYCHEHLVITGDGKWKCNNCGQLLIYKNSILYTQEEYQKMRIMRMSKIHKQVECPYCNKIAFIKGDGDWKCNNCGNTFVYKDSIVSKMENYENNIQIKCPYCSTNVGIPDDGRWKCPECARTIIYENSTTYKEEDLV